RTLGQSDRERIVGLIKQLGDDSFQVREKASADLIALGPIAVSYLERAANDADPEIVRRAADCLRQIDRGTSIGLVAAAVRLIGVRKPAGAVPVLLAYLPQAEDESVADEVRSSLAAVAVTDGKPDPVLVEALTDKVASRRGAAAEALCRAGAKDQLNAIRKLIKDPEPSVQLRVGLALVALKEKEAIPVLIELMGTRPYEEVWPVEDLLLRMAGDKAPHVDLGGDENNRKKCCEAWASWWAKNEATVDLAKIQESAPLLGYTLVILLDAGRIIDLDEKNKPRFTLESLEFPLDAQMLPGERILVCEHNGNRVTERNRKNEVIWKHEVQEPIMAQRLPNGNTFIATRSELTEVTKDHKAIFSYTRPDGDMFMKAIKLRNGDVAYLVNQGKYVRMDTAGKELTTFPAAVQTFGGRLEVLPNNHVLVPFLQANKVVEFDTKGKPVWEAAIDQPVAAVRLPNGHTLMTSMHQNRAFEVNREGKQIWEFKAESRVTRAFRR
ncbi:MAG TPA: HEAT repeat domain-containing protein, partial [Gemmataceae bacterium]|nr:HEAT repeat domain-containing protein [Gemmataceae bacterium]